MNGQMEEHRPAAHEPQADNSRRQLLESQPAFDVTHGETCHALEAYAQLGAAVLLDGAGPGSLGRSRRHHRDESRRAERYPHFMLKEIFEQPQAVRNTLCDRLDVESGDVHVADLRLSDWESTTLSRLVFVACGSSLHAALVGKYLIEAFARLPVEVDLASEFRYSAPVLDGRVLTVPISQSGETADTVAASRHARSGGSRVVAICNVVGSSMARGADGVLCTRAGREIGVAATKTFTAQLVAVLLLALRLGRARGMLEPDAARRIIRELQTVPTLMENLLALNDTIASIARRFAERSGFLYVGRGVQYPIALEGALKLKEVTCIQAEGYAAREMKHGPRALIYRGMPIVAIAPAGATYQTMVANIQDLKARGAAVIAIATRGDEVVQGLTDDTIFIPSASTWIQPLLTALPLQLFAYHTAVARGCEVDQPRSVARIVTLSDVEREPHTAS